MKGLIILSCLLAAATATHLGLSSQFHVQDNGQYSYGYAGGPSSKQESRTADGVTHGGYSYIDGNGHLQSVNYVADDVHGFRATGTNLPQAPIAHLHAPVAHGFASAPSPIALYPGYHGQHVIGHNGVPVDTPEVQHARAAHLAAHAEASARASHAHYRKRRSVYAYAPQHIPVIDHNGVPVETPEVQHAKAAHFAAHAQAAGRDVHYGYAPVHYAAAYPQHIPVIGHNGVPLDTPEVQHARAEHFAAHARAGHNVAAHHAYGYPYVYNAPQIGHDGVPLDTAEVAIAKAHHFAAHAEASARNSYPHGLHAGQPLDTPEVQHAKAAHFAAHAEAKARAHAW